MGVYDRVLTGHREMGTIERRREQAVERHHAWCARAADMDEDERCREYAPLARMLARRFVAERSMPERTWDEIDSGAFFGLFRACRNWTPDSGYSFSTALSRSVTWAILDTLRACNRVRSFQPRPGKSAEPLTRRVVIDLYSPDELPVVAPHEERGYAEVEVRVAAESVVRRRAAELVETACSAKGCGRYTAERNAAERNARIVLDRIRGDSCYAIAEREAINPSRVSQIVGEYRIPSLREAAA